MALGTLSWDLPSAEKMEAYNELTRKWIGLVLQQPGVKEFRAYRNPLRTTPQIMTHVEFDSMASWLAFVQSENYATILADLRELGCGNIVAGVWDTSPVAPEPLRPASR